MDRLLASLLKFDAARDMAAAGRADTVLTRLLASLRPKLAPRNYLNRFPVFLRNALETLGISALYAHQPEAIDYIHDGPDLVLEAPTAGEKTLCFNIPLALAMLDDPRCHALMTHLLEFEMLPKSILTVHQHTFLRQVSRNSDFKHLPNGFLLNACTNGPIIDGKFARDQAWPSTHNRLARAIPLPPEDVCHCRDMSPVPSFGRRARLKGATPDR